MKLVTYQHAVEGGVEQRTGALLGEAVVDLAAASAAAGVTDVPTDMLELLRGGEPMIEAAREALAFAAERGVENFDGRRLRFESSEVQLRAPLPRPNSMRDYLLVKEHVQGGVEKGFATEIPAAWYEMPACYKGNPDEVYGPDDVVPWPVYTDRMDYELEIAAVIGEPGRRISEADASRHIAGYTIFNDWSARDIQKEEMSIGIGVSNSKDFATSIGPCIATPDEFARDTAPLETRVDGEVWSTGTLGAMQFSFEQVIEWTSQEQTLHPGDLLASGTVGGGCGLDLGRFLSEGSTVEIEAAGIGVLRNVLSRKGEGARRAQPPEASRRG
jgi:2-keto-4-pentenoate hydratase/2-oxohepta-3-ene-1,7-dioic acid hydratase in catechol pathway